MTIVDLPATAAIAQRDVDEVALAERITVFGADVLGDPLGDSFDAAVLRGVVVVLALDDSRVTPPELATYNLQFATAVDHGGVYTEGEIRRWLTGAHVHDAIRVRSAAAYGGDFILAHRGRT